MHASVLRELSQCSEYIILNVKSALDNDYFTWKQKVQEASVDI